jgi:uncharacterized protein involved in exopolysaccharide biosynthesis
LTNTNHDESFDLRPYLAVVVRNRYLILTFVLSAAVTSLALTYVVSEKYVSHSTMLYKPNENVSFRPKDREALGFPTPLVSLESIGNTLDELLKSDGVIERVVRTLHLDQKRPREHSNWFMWAFHSTKDTVKEYGGKTWQLMRYGRILDKDPFGDAMAGLRKNINIRRTAKAYTFQLEALENDPKLAAAIVDEAASTLGAVLHEEQIRVARQTREGLAVRLQQNQSEIAELRGLLDSFKQGAHVSSLSEELSLKLKTVASFQEEYSRAQNELRALQRKRAEIQVQLDGQDRSVMYDSTSTQNPVVDEMKLELARLEVERSGLLGKYTEEHQAIKSLDARMAQVRRKLQTEESSVVRSESMRSNDIWQKLLGERMATDAEIEALTARISAYGGSIGQETGLARELTSKEQTLADLNLRLIGAERSYALLSEAFEEARIAESRASGQVSFLHKAFVPSAPARPIKILHVGVSAGLSLVLGIGLAFLFNFFDTSLRSIDQVERTLNLPVLGTIPAVRFDGTDSGSLLVGRGL